MASCTLPRLTQVLENADNRPSEEIGKISEFYYRASHRGSAYDTLSFAPIAAPSIHRLLAAVVNVVLVRPMHVNAYARIPKAEPRFGLYPQLSTPPLPRVFSCGSCRAACQEVAVLVPPLDVRGLAGCVQLQ